MKGLKDREQLYQYLRMHQLESVFPESLLPHLTVYSFDQGELICSQGDPALHLYVLVKGKIKIYTTSAEGRALILSFKTPLEVIGDIEYIRGRDIINTVEAVTPVHMIGVHHTRLKKYGSDHAPLLQFMLDIITQKFYVKSNSLSFNLLHPVEVRLAGYLLAVSFDESDAQFKGQIRTTSLKDVANLIGTSYRHLNRVIAQLCAEGLLERTQSLILIKNKEGLRRLAGHHIYEKSAKGRGEIMVIGLLLALMAGSLIGLQNIFNSRVNERAGTWATTTLVLGLGFLASMTIGYLFEGKQLFALQTMQTWYWFSGLIGVGVVVCMVQGIKRLGPMYAVSIVLTSQLAFALLWDSLGWLGLTKVPFTFKQLIGVLVIVGGILVFKLGGGRQARQAAVKTT